jgi:2-polyprenyl-6-methoxyphenol hydroxylase-like FAD-dependent oxidoreductase
MSLEKTTEVLVVGAGPVGMTTALLLAERGLKCAVIDAKGGPAARSYACALHPRSLELFGRLGLAEEMLSLGRRFETVAFYEGTNKQAEVKLSELPVKFPFLFVLPQSALEELLERALNRRAGIRVQWHHQLSDLRMDKQGVVANVDKLTGTAVGYIVPHWEMVVKNSAEIRASILIGADGHNSLVRQRIGIDYQQVGEPELFSVFEFETDGALPDEIRIVLDESTTNVLWPLTGRRGRWSFQGGRQELTEEFPDKDRRAVWIDDPERNRQIQEGLQHLIEKRAPWFTASVKDFDWVSQVRFERRLAKQFGNDCCWLVGDSAHQTGPVGTQSLNVGLREADELAETLKSRLRDGVAKNGFESWQRHWQDEWQRLLGLKGAMKASANTDKWVQQHAAKILPCLPASGEDLANCLKQFQLDLP